MKIIFTAASFLITLAIVSSLSFPLFWKIIAGVIVSFGVFFAFDSHGNQELSGTHSPLDAPSLDSRELGDYLPINEYNKKYGIATNTIKEQISSGELSGAVVNGIWYIHKDELQK